MNTATGFKHSSNHFDQSNSKSSHLTQHYTEVEIPSDAVVP